MSETSKMDPVGPLPDAIRNISNLSRILAWTSVSVESVSDTERTECQSFKVLVNLDHRGYAVQCSKPSVYKEDGRQVALLSGILEQIKEGECVMASQDLKISEVMHPEFTVTIYFAVYTIFGRNLRLFASSKLPLRRFLA